MSQFAEYVKHGWLLVPILPGQKSPRTREWNKREKCITEPAAAQQLRSAGLAHAYSGTCAVDIDDHLVAAQWLAERNVDLDALLDAPDSVQIKSGRAGRSKLLYALPEPLASKKVALTDEGNSALDLRCATASGLTVQDVLPPSIHPGTGTPYEWVYGDPLISDWRSLPPLPDALRELWEQALHKPTPEKPTEKRAALSELRQLLKRHDPSMGRDDWIKVGMAIHHETDGSHQGLALWDEWSQESVKYQGLDDLEQCWRSFHDTPDGITVASLRRAAVAVPDEFEVVTAGETDSDPWAAAKRERYAEYELIPIADIAKRPPPEWIVDGLLPQADLAMLFAPSGAGKSFVGLDLAFSVAYGFTWFNAATRQGPVIWVAAEAAGSMRNRARAYAQANGVELENADLVVLERPVSLMSNEDCEAMSRVFSQRQPSLIIVDTLAAASIGANENSSEDMSTVLANCRKMHSATGALVLLIHHAGKDVARGARGSSGLRAAVQTEFSIDQRSDSVRVLTVTKQRDAPSGAELPFKLQPVQTDFDAMPQCVVEPLDPVLVAKEGARLGAMQRLVLDTFNEMVTGQGDPKIPHDDLLDEVMMHAPGGKSNVRQRRSNIRAAIKSLCERGYMTFHDGKLTLGANYEDLPKM